MYPKRNDPLHRLYFIWFSFQWYTMNNAYAYRLTLSIFCTYLLLFGRSVHILRLLHISLFFLCFYLSLLPLLLLLLLFFFFNVYTKEFYRDTWIFFFLSYRYRRNIERDRVSCCCCALLLNKGAHVRQSTIYMVIGLLCIAMWWQHVNVLFLFSFCCSHTSHLVNANWIDKWLKRQKGRTEESVAHFFLYFYFLFSYCCWSPFFVKSLLFNRSHCVLGVSIDNKMNIFLFGHDFKCRKI